MQDLGSILREIRARATSSQGSRIRDLRDYLREEACPHGQVVRLSRSSRGQPWEVENPCPECRRERMKARLYRLSGLSEGHWPGGEKEATFETFDLSLNPAMERPYRLAREYCEGSVPPWLVFVGPVGNGKTHLAEAIAIAFLERLGRVKYWVVPHFLDLLKATFAPDSPRDFYEEMHRLAYDPELVTMDDFGTESPTPFANERLYLVLNMRYEHGLRTVITCNRAEDLRRNERIRSRLYDTSMCRVVHCQGEDVRPKLRGRSRQRCQSA